MSASALAWRSRSGPFSPIRPADVRMAAIPRREHLPRPPARAVEPLPAIPAPPVSSRRIPSRRDPQRPRGALARRPDRAAERRPRAPARLLVEGGAPRHPCLRQAGSGAAGLRRPGAGRLRDRRPPGPEARLPGLPLRRLARWLARVGQGRARVLGRLADHDPQARRRRRIAAGGGGFGQEAPRLGPVRLVGLATSADGSALLRRWLGEAGRGGSRRGADLPHPATIGAVVRALDAEDQVRPIDAIVPAGRRERLLLRFAPRSLRGVVSPIDPDTPAAEASATVQGQTRAPDA